MRKKKNIILGLVAAVCLLPMLSGCRERINRNDYSMSSNPEVFWASAKIIKIDLSTLEVDFFSRPGVLFTSHQEGRLTVGELSFMVGLERKEEDWVELDFGALIRKSKNRYVDLKHKFVMKLGKEKTFSKLIREDGENSLWVVIAKVQEQAFPVDPSERRWDGPHKENGQQSPALKKKYEWK